MITIFEPLDDLEVELMLKAPILVCILIAGADGNIDRKEIQEAIAVAGEKSTNDLLKPYLSEVLIDFEDKVMILKQGYSSNSSKRTAEVVEELSLLNDVLAKLDQDFSRNFYKMLRELAQKIATSSGGILGINAVGPEEAKYVDLPMISSLA